MITLPVPLAKVMQSGNLEGIKPFAVLYRNKWYIEESASGLDESDSGSDLGGHFALDMINPIDISDMIVKPNTLSMTLDVNEVAQYKANNVTLTLSDPFNKFIEGTPKSYFPQGYQLYGSQVVLYYGLDETNRTPLFVGVIKDLPTHKPEQYQVELKLISPLELLSDIEAKEFSNKYYGETLTLHGQDDDNNPIYQTINIGVGGFYAVYANGQKMFEGVDYEVSQTNELGLPALVTIINADLHSATITADYYCWKTGLTVEQIVSGLVALAGYTNNTDIRTVIWTNNVTTQYNLLVLGALGFYVNDGKEEKVTDYYSSNRWNWLNYGVILNNFKLKYNIPFRTGGFCLYLGDTPSNGDFFSVPDNGLTIKYETLLRVFDITYYINGNAVKTYSLPYTSVPLEQGSNIVIERHNSNFTITVNINSETTVYTDTYNINLNFLFMFATVSNSSDANSGSAILTFRDGNNNDAYTLPEFGVMHTPPPNATLITDIINVNSTLAKFKATKEGEGIYQAFFRYANNLNNFSNWQNIDFNTDIGQSGLYFQFMITQDAPWQQRELIVSELAAQFLGSYLSLQFVNLSGKTVLQALQDFALISGYEFGVDRQGVFFFRPRSQSTTSIYDLDSNEIVKIDNISKKFNDFFTKLTLTFAQVPLEFYANTGARPTPIDRYGVINKDIDKPEIVNYDNPELAQAIGPQLLAIYSSLADIIQLTGKLNLSLELGDVVNVKRNYNLTVPDSASDTTKFLNQNTYFQACKITGLNYNFSKRQITYTLRNVSNTNNRPQYTYEEFIYDFQVPFGVKE